MAARASRRPWHSPWFWVGVVAVAALMVFMVFSPTAKGWIAAVAEWAEGVMRTHPVAGAAVFFVLSAVSALIAFASSVVLVPPATEVWGKPVTFMLLWGGWMAGAAIAFGVGYFSRRLLHRLVSREDLAKYETLVSTHMPLWAAILLCLAVPSEIPGYLLGALHYRFWKFMVAIGTAEGIYGIGIVIAGDSLAEAEPGLVIGVAAALVAIAIVAGYFLRKKMKKRRA